MVIKERSIKQKKTANQNRVESQESHDTEGEYDYLGSEEGVAAKLDLARAYLAMDDRNAAQSTLQQVLKQGDKAQQQQARDLLKSLKSVK